MGTARVEPRFRPFFSAFGNDGAAKRSTKNWSHFRVLTLEVLTSHVLKKSFTDFKFQF